MRREIEEGASRGAHPSLALHLTAPPPHMRPLLTLQIVQTLPSLPGEARVGFDKVFVGPLSHHNLAHIV